MANEIAQMEKEQHHLVHHTLINRDNTMTRRWLPSIEVKVTPSQRGMGFDKIASGRIYQFSEVEAVYLDERLDFTVFIEGKTMRQVAQFVSGSAWRPWSLLLSTATHFVLKSIRPRHHQYQRSGCRTKGC